MMEPAGAAAASAAWKRGARSNAADAPMNWRRDKVDLSERGQPCPRVASVSGGLADKAVRAPSVGAAPAWGLRDLMWRSLSVIDQRRKHEMRRGRLLTGPWTKCGAGVLAGRPRLRMEFGHIECAESHFSLPFPDTLSHTLSELPEFKSNVRSRTTAGLRQSPGFCGPGGV